MNRQLTLQEKWQLDAERAKARRKEQGKTPITKAIKGKKVTTSEMKKY